MNNIKVTVITPSFNKPSFIFQTISSVLSQSMGDFEYIIVDNSTDIEVKKVIKQFEDRRIRLFEENFSNKRRKDIYVTSYICNKYYPKSKGEYIIFLADDDLMLSNCLSEMTSFLDENSEKNICYHDQFVLYAFDGKNFIEPMVRGNNKVMIFPENNPKHLLDGGQIMFRKKVLQQIYQPYFPLEWETANIMDKMFMERLWSRGEKFYPLNKCLTVKRVVTESTFRSRNPKEFNFYLFITRFLPLFMQQFLGKITGKRRGMKKNEKRRIERFIKSLNVM